MRFSLRNLVLSSAALCATTAFAANQTRVDVPFSFTIKNHLYPAGTYEVELHLERSAVILCNAKKPSQSLTWIVGPGESDPAHSMVRLTFDVIGQDHFLRTIQYDELTTPNLDKHPKRKVEGTSIVG
jgi:hypothetical protein